MNAFQSSLTQNKECIWKIVKIFHPDFPYDKRGKIKVSTMHDWVCIDGPGISIGITFECHLYSGPKPLHLFEQEVKNNMFKAWRFGTDSKFDREKGGEYEYLRTLYKMLTQDTLIGYGIKKPTAKQMSDYYHAD